MGTNEFCPQESLGTFSFVLIPLSEAVDSVAAGRAGDLPLVIEIVDSEEKINAFLPVLAPMIGGGLVTLEKVKVIEYRGNASVPASPEI